MDSCSGCGATHNTGSNRWHSVGCPCSDSCLVEELAGGTAHSFYDFLRLVLFRRCMLDKIQSVQSSMPSWVVQDTWNNLAF